MSVLKAGTRQIFLGENNEADICVTGGNLALTISGGSVTVNGNTPITGVTARKNSAGGESGPQPRINFIEGSDITITVGEDGGSGELDITIASTASAGDSVAAHFCAYDSSNTAIPTTAVDVPLGVELIKDSGFTHSTSTNPAEVTIDDAGTYEVTFDGTAKYDTGTSRAKVEWAVHRDTGGGFSAMTGGFAWSYHRTAGDGRASASINFIDTFAAGEKIKIVADSDYGTTAITTMAGGSRLTIKRLA